MQDYAEHVREFVFQVKDFEQLPCFKDHIGCCTENRRGVGLPGGQESS